MRVLLIDIDNAIDESAALEEAGFGDPIVDAVYVEEEVVTRTYNRWEF